MEDNKIEIQATGLQNHAVEGWSREVTSAGDSGSKGRVVIATQTHTGWLSSR